MSLSTLISNLTRSNPIWPGIRSAQLNLTRSNPIWPGIISAQLSAGQINQVRSDQIRPCQMTSNRDRLDLIWYGLIWYDFFSYKMSWQAACCKQWHHTGWNL